MILLFDIKAENSPLFVNSAKMSVQFDVNSEKGLLVCF